MVSGSTFSVPVIPKSSLNETIEGHGMRLDGRHYEEFRSVFMKTKVISQASGSAYLELGKTKVMVGVYGPRQGDRRDSSLERGSISCDVKLASFATRERGKFGQSLEERELSATLLTALQGVVLVETFPKASLDVYCTILEAGGSEPAVTITAAVLAIIDAGVEVRDVLTACAVSKTKTLKSNGGMNETVLVLDPTNEEMDREQGGMLIAATGSGSLDVSQLVVWGPWEEGELKEGLELGLGGCAELHAAARQHLKESVLSSL